MRMIGRRALLAGGSTVASALASRKPRAAETLRPLSGALVPTDPPQAPPAITFVDAGGARHALSEFAGHGMVVNLWATWCVPCVAELPSLARLAAALAPADIAVLPLSSDRGGSAAVDRFFRAHDISGLPTLLDPDGDAARAWGARGIPTTLVIDVRGMERARLEGSADWSSPEAAALVRRLTS
jgi:thiol-disulfide isomerase/thioredoxin